MVTGVRRPPLLLLVMTLVTLPPALMLATASRLPMLFRSRHLAVPNPFRNRAPERVAERFLTQLRDGNRAVLVAVVDKEDRARILARETEHPLVRWRLGNRRNEDDGVWLLFMARRGNGYSGGEVPVAMTVRGMKDDGQVVEYSAMY